MGDEYGQKGSKYDRAQYGRQTRPNSNFNVNNRKVICMIWPHVENLHGSKK